MNQLSVIILALVTLLPLACAPAELASGHEDDLLNGLLGLYVVNDGNCLHSYKAAANAALLHCSRDARATCGVDRKIDETGRLILTAEKRSAYIAEWSWLSDIYPSCQTTAASVSLLPGFQTTDVVSYDDIRLNNVLESRGVCETLVATQLDTLVNREEHVFLMSARGALAVHAQRISETQCRNDLITASWESGVVDDVAAGNRVLQTSCRYGSSSAVILPLFTACTASEESLAAPFDF